MLSPLQLDAFALHELIVARGEPVKPGQRSPSVLEYEVALDFDVSKLPARKGARRSRVTLGVKLESAKPEVPCPVRVVAARLEGTFSFASGTPKKVREQLVPGNCLAMLYGILRGVVIQATSGCPGGCFILPSLNIAEIVRRKEAGEEAVDVLRARRAPAVRKRLPKRRQKAARRTTRRT